MRSHALPCCSCARWRTPCAVRLRRTPLHACAVWRTWSSTNEIIASFSVIVCAASSSAFCTDAAAVHCAAHRPMPRPCAGDRVAAVVMRASLRWRYRCTRSLALPCVREHVGVSVCAFLLFVSVRARARKESACMHARACVRLVCVCMRAFSRVISRFVSSASRSIFSDAACTRARRTVVPR